jgi:hypothetical protein
VSAILSFVLLMALHPDVQRRIQTELDDVIGCDHLPHPSDLNHLPYLMAVLKEVLRYAPIANLGAWINHCPTSSPHSIISPTALPHKVIDEDEYQGYRIPKDATIIANVW